jgi:putative transposase
MRYAAIATIPSPVSVSRRCGLLGVSRSGYYAWRTRRPSRRATLDGGLLTAIRRIHAAVDRSYGSPRIHRELRAEGVACGRHRIARLMRAAGVMGKQRRRFRRTTESRHAFAIAPNRLGRDFTATAPNQVWMGDVTYIPTGTGWSYLAVLLDAFSRRVVGWAVGTQLTAALPLEALERAVQARQPPAGLLHHSDRGIQYACDAYQRALRTHSLEGSMSRRGDCWDNAVVESFFASLKVERLHERHFATVEHVRHEVEDYIERFYNRERRHSTLGYVSPVIYELRHVA